MFTMSCSRDNNASNYVEDLPGNSHILQQNEETEEIRSKQCVITISSSDSSNESEQLHTDEVSSIYNMPIDSPSYTHLEGNMAGEFPSHVHRMEVNNDKMTTEGHPFNYFPSSEMARSPLDIEGNAAPGASSNSRGSRERSTSHIHSFGMDDDDSMSIAALLDDFHSQHVDPCMMDIGDNLAAKVRANSQPDTAASDTIQAQTVNFIGGNSAARVRVNYPHGIGIGMSGAHGVPVNHNDDLRLSGQLNTLQGQQIDRTSMSIENNTAARFLAISQCGREAVHRAPSNTGNVSGAATHSNNFQIPQITGRSKNIGGNRATGFQSNSQGSELNRSSMNNGGNVGAGVRPNSKNKSVAATDLRSNMLSLGGIYASPTNRNSFGVGRNMPEVHQSKSHERLMVSNDAMRNEDRSNNAPDTEQIDNSLLNLGLGGNLGAGFQSDVLGGGISYNNKGPVSTNHLPQAEGSFLSLGGSMDGRILSNNNRRTICDTNGRANQDTNGRANQEPANVSQILPGDGEQYFHRSTRRSLAGNQDVEYANVYLNNGFPGHPRVVQRSFNSIPAGVSTSNQARRSRQVPRHSSVMEVSHGSLPSQLQQAPHGSFPSQLQQAPNGSIHTLLQQAPHGSFPIQLQQAPQESFPTQLQKAPHGSLRTQLQQTPHGTLSTQLPQAPHGSFPTQLQQAPQGSFPTQLQQAPHGSFRTQLQQTPHGTLSTQLQQAYLNNSRSIPNRFCAVSSLTSSVGRTSGQEISDHPFRLDNSLAVQAAKSITDLSGNGTQAQTAHGVTRVSSRGHSLPPHDAAVGSVANEAKNKQAQTAQGTILASSRGKRGPIGGQSVQSAKLLRGPSAGPGKLAAVAGNVGRSQDYGAVAGPLIQGRKLLSTSAATRQVPKVLTTPAGGTRGFDYIKFNGFSEPSAPVGEKCQLCKRDLVLTSTGRVTQPPVPPPVAVLPCGHTFHDECLERITPPDQAKDPPCIPCAIGTS